MEFHCAIQRHYVMKIQSRLRQKYLYHPWPYVYIYTKAVSEDFIKQYMDRVPIEMVRPTVGRFNHFVLKNNNQIFGYSWTEGFSSKSRKLVSSMTICLKTKKFSFKKRKSNIKINH